jgi:hypothetical protein
MTLTSYKTESQNRVDVIEHYGGAIGQDPELLSLVIASITDVDERAKSSRNRYIGMIFLAKSDRRRYGILWADLENQFARGNNQYPKELTEAYGMLVNYKPPFPIKNKDPERSIPATVKSTCDTVSEMTGTTLLGTSSAATVPGVSGDLHTHTHHVFQLQLKKTLLTRFSSRNWRSTFTGTSTGKQLSFV